MNTVYRKIVSNHFLQLFVDPSYLFFSISVFFSQVAFNMLNVVLIFLIFKLTSSNFAVAILLFAVLIPQIFISFFGGIIADIGNKKMILVIGNLLRAAVILILFFNFKSIGLVYLVTILVSGITQFYVPAEAPLIPSLVEKDKLVAANSIFGISFFGSVLLGYVAAGPAINLLGRGNVFLVLSVIFVLAGIFAAIISQERARKTKVETADDIKRSIKHEFRETFSIVKKTKEVAEAFFLLTFSQIIIFILATLIPGYAKNVLDIPAESLSTLIFAPAAVGMLVSGIALGSIFHRTSKKKLMNIGIFISGLVLFLLPFTSRLHSYDDVAWLNTWLPHILRIDVFNFVLVIAFFAGFANALIFIPSQAVIQEVVPENFRSKIYGLLFALIGLFSLIPIIVAGGVADIVGVSAVLTFLGIVILLIGISRGKIVPNLITLLLKDNDY